MGLLVLVAREVFPMIPERMGKHGQSSASLFDFGPLACGYEAWYQTAEGREHDRIQQSAVKTLLPQAHGGGLLLDVGCGTGHWSRFFASMDYAVTGVDISPPMIAAALSQITTGCAYIIGDARRLPFADATFQVSTGMAALEFMPDDKAALREMARLTKPGGYLMIGTLNRLAPLSRARIEQAQEPYFSGRLFSPDELWALLRPYGEVTLCAPYCKEHRTAPGACNSWDDPFVIAGVRL